MDTDTWDEAVRHRHTSPRHLPPELPAAETTNRIPKEPTHLLGHMVTDAENGIQESPLSPAGSIPHIPPPHLGIPVRALI